MQHSTGVKNFAENLIFIRSKNATFRRCQKPCGKPDFHQE